MLKNTANVITQGSSVVSFASVKDAQTASPYLNNDYYFCYLNIYIFMAHSESNESRSLSR